MTGRAESDRAGLGGSGNRAEVVDFKSDWRAGIPALDSSDLRDQRRSFDTVVLPWYYRGSRCALANAVADHRFDGHGFRFLKGFFLEYLRTFRFSGGTQGTGGTASNGKASSGSPEKKREGTGGTGASVKMGWYFATP
jgi:hypothetical protein